MKRAELEKFLGKKVEVKLFNGDIVQGILHKTGEEMFKSNLNLYIPENRYFLTDDNDKCISYLFRSSHVKKINWGG